MKVFKHSQKLLWEVQLSFFPQNCLFSVLVITNFEVSSCFSFEMLNNVQGLWSNQRELKGLETSDGNKDLRNAFFAELPAYVEKNNNLKFCFSISFSLFYKDVTLTYRISRYLSEVSAHAPVTPGYTPLHTSKPTRNGEGT